MRASPWERLAASPWRLVLVVALVLAAPILLAGELSDASARERVRQEELRATTDTSRRAADAVTAQISRVADSLRGATTSTDLKVATTEDDVTRLGVLLRNFRTAMSRDVRRLFVVKYTAQSELLAQDPFDDRLVGTSQSDWDYVAALREERTGGAVLAAAYYLSAVYASDGTSAGPFVALSSRIVAPLDRGGNFVGILVAEVDLSAMRTWLQPILGSAEDVYVVDGRGRLIGQAAPLDPSRGTDLASLATHPVVAAALRGSAPATETDDPVGRGRRLLAAAPARVGPSSLSTSASDAHWNWQVLVERPYEVAPREVDAALGQARALRIGLVLLLLAGSYSLSRAASTVLRHRHALAETNVRLARASDAKSQFLASVSHELRTPLNAILGFTDALLAGVDGPLNDEQRTSLGWVQRGGQDLLALINEVLDLARIESGKVTIAPESFAPVELVESVVAQHRSLAAQKAIAFSWRDEGAPAVVILDKQRTRQIIVNLCGNALKFTTHGSVEVVIGGATNDWLTIEVRDTGPGIPASERDAIFEEFRQIDHRVAGTGLGLAISRRLARLMGGDITVESELERGSVFRVRLPVDCRIVEPAIEETAAKPLDRLLLAIDDDPSVAPLLDKMLSDRGFRVVGVGSAGAAVAEARRLHPSAITLDLLMPDRDGRDLLHDLRADPLTRDIPVIVLSVVDASDAPSDADAHLTKPVRRDRLLRALDRLAAGRSA